jgi:hypothetical protein
MQGLSPGAGAGAYMCFTQPGYMGDIHVAHSIYTGESTLPTAASPEWGIARGADTAMRMTTPTAIVAEQGRLPAMHAGPSSGRQGQWSTSPGRGLEPSKNSWTSSCVPPGPARQRCC